MSVERGLAVRAVVRPYGSALPLAFFAFGIGMFLLGGQALGWIQQSDQKQAGIFLASFVFPLEFLAAVIAFLSRDGATGAALGLFSTSWLGFGLVSLVGTPGKVSSAEGIYLLGFTAMVMALAIASFAAKPLLGMLLWASALRAVLAGVYQLGAARGFDRAAGVIAIFIFAVSVYAGLAFTFEESKQKAVLPTFRRGDSAEAMGGAGSADPSHLVREAGVRTQL